MRPLARVHPLVHRQRRPLNKRFGTPRVVAPIRPLVRMNPQVPLQIRPPRELLQTFLAHMRPRGRNTGPDRYHETRASTRTSSADGVTTSITTTTTTAATHLAPAALSRPARPRTCRTMRGGTPSTLPKSRTAGPPTRRIIHWTCAVRDGLALTHAARAVPADPPAGSTGSGRWHGASARRSERQRRRHGVGRRSRVRVCADQILKPAAPGLRLNLRWRWRRPASERTRDAWNRTARGRSARVGLHFPLNAKRRRQARGRHHTGGRAVRRTNARVGSLVGQRALWLPRSTP